MQVQNLPALAIILDQWLQSSGFPQREKVMAAVAQYLQGVQQALAQQQMAGQPGVPPGAGPDQGGAPGNNPGLQGGHGNPARAPTNPTPPPPPGPADNLPPGRMSDATAQVIAGA